MNEAQTRLNKIDPRLRDAGWSIIPGSKILVEQSAYIAPGRITTTLDALKSKVDRLQSNFEKISQECDALKQAILKKYLNKRYSKKEAFFDIVAQNY